MNRFGFVSTVPIWSVTLVLLLVVVSIWFEIKKRNRFLVGRIVAVVLIGISLFGFLLQPFYERTTKDEILLLTPGFKDSQVDSLLKQNPNLKQFRMKDCNNAGNATLAEDDFFEKRGGNIRLIVGEGLSSSTLETMRQKNFQFLPSHPDGIIKLLFPSDVTENHKSTLRGVVNCTADSRLRLVGPSGVEDSVRLKKGDNQSFTLSFWPKQKGKFVYELETQTGNLISREPLAFDVKEEWPLKILFLQKFPTAETKNLKNFLSERQHSIVLRYQVSREAFNYEFVNLPESRLKNTSREVLNSFDLLFIDATSLISLSRNEKLELIAAVRDGLGVIVLQSQAPENLQWFWPLKFKPGKKDTAHIHLEKKYTLPVLPFLVDSEGKNIYTVFASGTRTLSGYSMLGSGKIGFTLLQETYRIKVEGNEKDYSKIWSDLISKTSRSKNSDQIQIKTPFPVYQNEPIDVDVIAEEPVSFLSDSTSMALKEDLTVDNFWHAKIWAGQPGWHELRTKNTTLCYFVAPENSWKSLRASKRISEVQKVASTQKFPTSQAVERRKVSLLVFFVLFVMSAGFLWLAPKL